MSDSESSLVPPLPLNQCAAPPAPPAEDLQFQHAEFGGGTAAAAADPELAAAELAGGDVALAERPQTFVRRGQKVGRNDPCPCGSGKKYKHCHGKLT